MKHLYRDPIVEEIRRRAEKLAARFDFDLERLGEYLRQREQESGAQLVDRSALTGRRARPAAAAHRVRAPKRP
jgi:hypothetical protein